MTQVEALAKYAARASFADLSAESRRQLPIHILDSAGLLHRRTGRRSRSRPVASRSRSSAAPAHAR